jgi:hypothetical protein
VAAELDDLGVALRGHIIGPRFYLTGAAG